jgi:dolichol-phosphate mannosyltransferase
MLDKTPKVSVVFPVFNEENNLETLYEQVKQACTQSRVDYEMVFVDNGSTDNSLKAIKGLRERDKKVKFVSLSRNFGHQNALFAGMSDSGGDAVITMDADLQHPPSLIPKMIAEWQSGTEVVYTTKKEDHSLGFMKLAAVKAFYWLISKISGMRLYYGQSDFRLLDKKVLEVILQIPEYHKFLRGQVEWVGFRQHGLTYNVEKRHSGKSKFSYQNLFSFALDGIFAFSKYPLHLLMLFGIIVAGMSFIYIVSVVIIWLVKLLDIVPVYIPPGWFTLTISIFFLGSVQLIAIGILGEYIGRTFDQTKGRPIFIIRERSI